MGRDMKRIVLVDNNAMAMMATPDNGIPIRDFFGDTDDRDLEALAGYLDYLATLDDVRPELTSRFNIRQQLRLTSHL
jgi:TFIIF-interacting CTD phosphatase-like protein